MLARLIQLLARTRSAGVFASTALVALSSAGSAAGATVELESQVVSGSRGGTYTVSLVRVVGGAGEANTLDISRPAEDRVIVRDEIGLEPRGGCVAAGPHEVLCVARDLSSVRVTAGDGDDSVTVDGVPTSIEGGEGNDTLRVVSNGSWAFDVDGGPGDDLLIGGEREERLYGGRGVDEVRGGGGRDVVSGGVPPRYGAAGDPESCGERDVLDGGAGIDVVDYTDHPCPIRVDVADLGRATGADGEGDVLTGVEGVDAGSGDDTLLGSGGADRLNGNGGDDLVDGRAGDDSVAGGEGDDVVIGGNGNDSGGGGPGRNEVAGGAGDDRLGGSGRVSGGEGNDELRGTEEFDVLDGGPGDDRIDSSEFAFIEYPRTDVPEVVRCGEGNDTVVPVDSTAVPSPSLDTLVDCERADIALGAFVPLLPAGLRGRVATVHVPCAWTRGSRCSFSVSLVRSGRVIGRGRGFARDGRFARVPVRLAEPVERSANRRLRVAMTRRTRAPRAAQGFLERAAYTVLLSRPGAPGVPASRLSTARSPRLRNDSGPTT